MAALDGPAPLATLGGNVGNSSGIVHSSPLKMIFCKHHEARITTEFMQRPGGMALTS